MQGLYLESESQVTKKIGSAVQRKRNLRQVGTCVWKQFWHRTISSLVHTHVGRNRLFFFFHPVLLTNDHITTGEKMSCRDSEISWKAEPGVCSWGISIGCIVVQMGNPSCVV